MRTNRKRQYRHQERTRRSQESASTASREDNHSPEHLPSNTPDLPSSCDGGRNGGGRPRRIGRRSSSGRTVHSAGDLLERAGEGEEEDDVDDGHDDETGDGEVGSGPANEEGRVRTKRRSETCSGQSNAQEPGFVVRRSDCKPATCRVGS